MGDTSNKGETPAKPRSWTVPGLVCLAAVGLAAFFAYSQNATAQISQDDYAARTEMVLRTTPLIDGHNDLPFLLRLELHNQIYDNKSFPFRESEPSQSHGPGTHESWSVFVECDKSKLAHPNDPTHAVRDTLEQIDVARRLIASSTPELGFCDTSSCAGASIAVLRQLHGLGVRYVTLTHNCDNPFATAASTVTATGEDAGLSAFGRAAVAEMNRLGVMVDLAHVSHRTMRDVLDVTEAPVILSHSTCYELAKVYRSAPDDVLARLRENGGVLMVMFVRQFLDKENPGAANIETVVDHIMHVDEVAGWDHVGIGGDFDGVGLTGVADGVNSVADYPALIQAVMRRGATDEQIRKLVGENILRVWKKNEEVAAEISASRRPVEDVWEGRTWFSDWEKSVPVVVPGNPNRHQ
ncbi:hypothetical protein INS49_013615 [Diaporthe citri]|uniref:uncharacterized protein n=1 Tax=Diaporthe citri TaxID=83186 RepID=UPI001C81FB07|nr:uncharacterized protein INS49_013615 [Diaporthe citri]KAG6357736.1 hypothetical protein INS49_013615 [Diaporthe citri]